jgi:hypothetical protein
LPGVIAALPPTLAAFPAHLSQDTLTIQVTVLSRRAHSHLARKGPVQEERRSKQPEA